MLCSTGGGSVDDVGGGTEGGALPPHCLPLGPVAAPSAPSNGPNDWWSPQPPSQHPQHPPPPPPPTQPPLHLSSNVSSDLSDWREEMTAFTAFELDPLPPLFSPPPLQPYRCEGPPQEVADVLLSLKHAVVHPPTPPPSYTSPNLQQSCGYGVSLEVNYFPPTYHEQHLQPSVHQYSWSGGGSPLYTPSGLHSFPSIFPELTPQEAQEFVCSGDLGVISGGPGSDGGIGTGTNLNGTSRTGGKSSPPSPRPNLCRICGKTYARPSTLKTHLRTHSGEKPYRCDDCNKSFSQAANLTAHVRTHSGEKPFRCPICARRFSQSSSVTTHMRTHSGERPYRCRLCKKAFSDSSTLTKHLRIHSGEKPYQCKLCLLRFSQSGNLNRHMRVHSSGAS